MVMIAVGDTIIIGVGAARAHTSSSAYEHIIAKSTVQNVNSVEVRHSGATLHLERMSNPACLALADVTRDIEEPHFIFIVRAQGYLYLRCFL